MISTAISELRTAVLLLGGALLFQRVRCLGDAELGEVIPTGTSLESLDWKPNEEYLCSLGAQDHRVYCRTLWPSSDLPHRPGPSASPSPHGDRRISKIVQHIGTSHNSCLVIESIETGMVGDLTFFNAQVSPCSSGSSPPVENPARSATGPPSPRGTIRKQFFTSQRTRRDRDQNHHHPSEGSPIPLRPVRGRAASGLRPKSHSDRLPQMNLDYVLN